MLSAVEVSRALARSGFDALDRAGSVLDRITQLAIDRSVIMRAAIRPVSVRSLDAVHLASALELGEDLGALVTYDERMAGAAHGLGMLVVSPA